jgi:hypothetical protein
LPPPELEDTDEGEGDTADKHKGQHKH